MTTNKSVSPVEFRLHHKKFNIDFAPSNYFERVRFEIIFQLLITWFWRQYGIYFYIQKLKLLDEKLLLQVMFYKTYLYLKVLTKKEKSVAQTSTYGLAENINIEQVDDAEDWFSIYSPDFLALLVKLRQSLKTKIPRLKKKRLVAKKAGVESKLLAQGSRAKQASMLGRLQVVVEARARINLLSQHAIGTRKARLNNMLLALGNVEEKILGQVNNSAVVVAARKKSWQQPKLCRTKRNVATRSALLMRELYSRRSTNRFAYQNIAPHVLISSYKKASRWSRNVLQQGEELRMTVNAGRLVNYAWRTFSELELQRRRSVALEKSKVYFLQHKKPRFLQSNFKKRLRLKFKLYVKLRNSAAKALQVRMSHKGKMENLLKQMVKPSKHRSQAFNYPSKNKQIQIRINNKIKKGAASLEKRISSNKPVLQSVKRTKNSSVHPLIKDKMRVLQTFKNQTTASIIKHRTPVRASLKRQLGVITKIPRTKSHKFVKFNRNQDKKVSLWPRFKGKNRRIRHAKGALPRISPIKFPQSTLAVYNHFFTYFFLHFFKLQTQVLSQSIYKAVMVNALFQEEHLQILKRTKFIRWRRWGFDFLFLAHYALTFSNINFVLPFYISHVVRAYNQYKHAEIFFNILRHIYFFKRNIRAIKVLINGTYNRHGRTHFRIFKIGDLVYTRHNACIMYDAIQWPAIYGSVSLKLWIYYADYSFTKPWSIKN